MLADCRTKPVNGELLHTQVSYLIGVHYYPHSSTKHCQLLAFFDCSYFKNVSKARLDPSFIPTTIKEGFFAGVLWWLMHLHFWHSKAMWLGSTFGCFSQC